MNKPKYPVLPLTVAVAATLSSGLSPSSVQAQAGMLEEVVVVARKREESLQETPVAVTAMNAEALKEANIRDLGDLTRVVPGLDTRSGDKYAAFSIRGIGSRGGKSVATDPAVGVYVDGIFIPRSDSQLVDVVAMQNIQVLRGPQGTLFGKNTAGGAILLTTVKPGDELAGEVGMDVGNLDRFNVNGNVDVPITDALSMRFTVDSRNRDGYMDDVNNGRDYGDEDKIAYAAQTRWFASDELTADFLLFYSEQKENSAPQTCRVADNSTPLQGFIAPGDERTLLPACQQSWELAKDNKVEMDDKGLDWEVETTMAGLTLEWERDIGTFKSISGYLHQEDINNWRDQDATSLFSLTNLSLVKDQFKANGLDVDEDRDFYTQEFQFIGNTFDDQLNYTLGLFYSKEEINNNPGGNMLSPAGFLGIPGAEDIVTVLPPDLAGFRTSNLTDFDNETWAAFAQGTWHFNDTLSLTLGGRYGEETKKAEQNNYVTAEESPGMITREEFDALQGTIHEVIAAPGVEFIKGDDDWSKFTPSATLSYVADDHFLDTSGLDSFMIYSTWSQGFKAGGFVVFDNELQTFDPEEVTNIEVGIKLDALDQRLRTNLAIYSMDYDDMQITVTRQISELNTAPSLANAGKATVQGVELEVSFLPTPNWFFQATANFIDAEYDEFDDLVRDPISGNFVPIDRKDEDFAYLPEQSFSWIAQYTLDTDMGEFSGRVSGTYKDDIYIGLEGGADVSDFDTLDGYTLWNTRLNWRAPEGNIEVALYVDNLADKEYFGTGNLQYGAQGTQTLVKGIERTYGVQATYRF